MKSINLVPGEASPVGRVPQILTSTPEATIAIVLEASVSSVHFPHKKTIGSVCPIFVDCIYILFLRAAFAPSSCTLLRAFKMDQLPTDRGTGTL
jgi:hypothetical protein